MKLSTIFSMIWGALVYIIINSLVPNLKNFEFFYLWQYWVLLVIPICSVTWLDKN